MKAFTQTVDEVLRGFALGRRVSLLILAEHNYYMKTVPPILIALVLFYSCSGKKTRRMLFDDEYAEGNISKDSIFNGLIRFYDTATNKLTKEAYYRNDTLDGKRTDYYSNGRINYQGFYKDGLAHGIAQFYDSAGVLTQEQSMYYGLKVGPIVIYENDSLSSFTFNDLNNNTLVLFDYDTIQNKAIQKINDNDWFFWHFIYHVDAVDLFVYTPYPPRFNFKYSLVIMNDQFEVSEVIEEFDPSKPFTITALDFGRLEEAQYYGLRIEFDNEFDNTSQPAYMFKKLEYEE